MFDFMEDWMEEQRLNASFNEGYAAAEAAEDEEDLKEAYELGYATYEAEPD